MIKKYVSLTKPGIVMGNAMTCTCGYFLGARGQFNSVSFLFTLLGLCLIVASGCVFNNAMDRHHDEKMARTKNRPLVTGAISPTDAKILGFILLFLGCLFLLGDLLALSLALFGLFVYLALYTLFKYKTSYATLIGSIAGGIPPVVGYVGASGHLDLGAFLIFSLVVLWQMPHFFAIALYRFEEYKRAGIPVLPVAKGIFATKVQMFGYVLAFILSGILFTFFGLTGALSLIAILLLGASWLFLIAIGFKTPDTKAWAKAMFRLSLVIVTVMSVVISLDTFLA